MQKIQTPAGQPIITPAGQPLRATGEPTYRDHLIATHRGLQAELAAGGKRRRWALKAVEIAETVDLAHRLGYEHLFQINMQSYRRFTATIGYDPIA